MKLPLEWLSEFVDISDIDTKRYCDRMTDTGSKVEGYEVLGAEIENVVVGEILSVVAHPDSDHLVICMVNVGEDAPRQIVTGASNVFAGALVPVAKAPAKLPGGVVIKAGKLRGVASDGMMCSIAELGLTLHDMPYAIEDGILILKEDCKAGDDIRDVLKLSDTVVEYEITPNRPDCLSVIGLARETGASFDRAVKYHTPVVRGAGDDIANYLSVRVDVPDLCPRYTAKVVKNVRIAPSPLWMRARLRAAGVRPINNIVDITNYVMLEYGQPMHAFDYTCLSGNQIVVRAATDGEVFRSLDSIDHTLRAGMAVIADAEKPVALAGVMGGENSEICDTTKTVVFESANFMGSSVRITSRALGMRTESSGRFEKGLDTENTLPAVLRACELVELLDAGDVVDGTIDVYAKPWKQTVLPLEVERINRFLGVNLSEQFMVETLQKLDFAVANGKVAVPSWRADVESMNDIAEEVIRIYGYNEIVSTAFTAAVRPGVFTARQTAKNEVCDALCGMGGYEIHTFSFVSPKNADKIGFAADDVRRNAVVLTNPLGEDTSVMRTSLLPSMMDVLARNNNYHSEDVFLYEVAPVYLPRADKNELPNEPMRIAIGMYGGCDFYHLKGVVEGIFARLGVKGVTMTACTDNPTFHPGQTATVCSGDVVLGVFGAVHPTIAANYGFDRPVYLADLDLDAMRAVADNKKQYAPLPKYPTVTRDLALLCPEEMEVGTLIAAIRRAGGKLLVDVKVFDVYRGKQVAEGAKSVALSLALRASDRTLTVEEADALVAKVLRALDKTLGVTLRG